ncbi:hypothetical protein NYA30BAC_02266 [Halomonas sp. NYA30]
MKPLKSLTNQSDAKEIASPRAQLFDDYCFRRLAQSVNLRAAPYQRLLILTGNIGNSGNNVD